MQLNELISGQSVLFKLKDAACPDLREIVRATGPELQVTGNIVFFSDGGDQKKRFAVVEVAGIHAPLIVPVERLESVGGAVQEQSCRSAENRSRRVC